MKLILRELLAPLVRRAGTALATYLAVQGVPQDDIDALVKGLAVGAALAFDLIVSHMARYQGGR